MATTMPDFTYTRLDGPDDCFRLLELVSANQPDDELYGVLTAYRRENAPAYSPVSYTWGQEQATSKILLKNAGDAEWQRFAIRPNLEGLLKQFRRSLKTEPKTIWVDAICIDQNGKEKGHQVRNMDKVYRDHDLIIWLGEPSPNSDIAMDLLKQCTDIGVETGAIEYPGNRDIYADFVHDSSVPASSWRALQDLISRPWFSRRWIVQEFVLTKHKHFWVGNRSQCFEQLIFLAWALRTWTLHLQDERQRRNYCDLIPDHTHPMPSSELDPLERLARLWAAHRASVAGNKQELTLERLLDNFAGFLSFDPRDGIYAFLSMASDVDVSKWLPDYSKENTTMKLFGNAVIQVIRSSGSCDIICRCAQDREFASEKSHRSGWIPWLGPQEVDFGNRCHNGSVRHCSCGEELPQRHVHLVHGYKTESLTTFGLAPQRLIVGQKGWIDQNLCDGCDKVICGTGVRCLECPDFDYCVTCAWRSDLTHDPTHHFKLHNGAVYSASWNTVLQIAMEPGEWRPCRCPIPSCPSPLGFGGFIIDTIKAVDPRDEVTMVRYKENIIFNLPWNKWMSLPGMEDHVDENGITSEAFCKVLTGNRRVANGQIRHVTDTWIKTAQERFALATGGKGSVEDKNSLRDLPGFVNSVEFMLSDQRRLATTNTSLGLVPGEAKPGDRIAILIGCSVPVVIREVSAGGKSAWRLVGESYIQGLMEGEAMTMIYETGIHAQEINLT